MAFSKRTLTDPTRCSLKKMCELITNYSYPYEEMAELIEDKGYSECSEGNVDEVIKQLIKLSSFFEKKENKNEKTNKYLADIYLLIGEFCQCTDMFSKSIKWFEKSIDVNDTNDIAYHSIAMSYLQLGETDRAVKSLEKEINIAPGNYFSYLLLSDLYEKQEKYDDIERILMVLLSRDPDNIQALHKLICHYDKRNPKLDVELLRRRLINADKTLIKLDLVIWTYHMLKEGKHEEALHFLNERELKSSNISITHLLKAHIYGCMKQFVKKRQELIEFKKLNSSREEFIRVKFDEFSKVFGKKASMLLQKRLSLSHITSR